MAVIANTIKFLPLWHRLPDISAMPEPAKPQKISSPEIMDPTTVLSASAVKAKLLQAVGQNGVGGADLFAQFALDTEMVQALPENWIYAYYLNARYGRPMPVDMVPIRIGSIYSENAYLLAPLMVCSAILIALWDETRDTINPTIKAENNWLMRCLIQINYVIYKIVQSNPTATPNSELIVCAQTAFGADGQEQIAWLDADQLELWEATGKTAQEAAEWWFEQRTQPTI